MSHEDITLGNEPIKMKIEISKDAHLMMFIANEKIKKNKQKHSVINL